MAERLRELEIEESIYPFQVKQSRTIRKNIYGIDSESTAPEELIQRSHAASIHWHFFIGAIDELPAWIFQPPVLQQEDIPSPYHTPPPPPHGDLYPSYSKRQWYADNLIIPYQSRRGRLRELFSWNKMLKNSRMDVTLACEAYVSGLAFVTADKKIEGDFGFALRKFGVTGGDVEKQSICFGSEYDGTARGRCYLTPGK
ncbi:hypothetical protein TWF481_006880 [Arthrobotrys musiformis]|uniref:PIN domain-containing protein n=1 Tax=Arthrobotrys musiformis TaxID=47236 RepID=A0AAV9WFJ1_9PEZI